MSQDNQITLRGYVTAEPKFRQTAKGGVPFAEIRVGSAPRRLNRETGEWEELAASYYTVKCWRRLAVNASSSLHKGDRVIIRGRFSLHQWVDGQQQNRERMEIEADSLGHDLAYGWSHFLRGVQSRPGAAAALDAGEAARQELELAAVADSDDDGPEADFGAAAGFPGGWTGPATEPVTESDEQLESATADAVPESAEMAF